MHPEFTLKISNLFDKDSPGLRLRLNHVQIAHGGRLPIDNLEKISDQPAFAASFRPSEQERMSEPTLGICFAQIG